MPTIDPPIKRIDGRVSMLEALLLKTDDAKSIDELRSVVRELVEIVKAAQESDLQL